YSEDGSSLAASSSLYNILLRLPNTFTVVMLIKLSCSFAEILSTSPDFAAATEFWSLLTRITPNLSFLTGLESSILYTGIVSRAADISYVVSFLNYV
ncbi:MAG: hypothetical protein QF704_17145, partial [Anaerolineales bacterium]|nr:hypothetical protein [Anaerolineales bacterium]